MKSLLVFLSTLVLFVATCSFFLSLYLPSKNEKDVFCFFEDIDNTVLKSEIEKIKKTDNNKKNYIVNCFFYQIISSSIIFILLFLWFIFLIARNNKEIKIYKEIKINLEEKEIGLFSKRDSSLLTFFSFIILFFLYSTLNIIIFLIKGFFDSLLSNFFEKENIENIIESYLNFYKKNYLFFYALFPMLYFLLTIIFFVFTRKINTSKTQYNYFFNTFLEENFLFRINKSGIFLETKKEIENEKKENKEELIESE